MAGGQWSVEASDELACEWTTCRALEVALFLFSFSLQLFWICKTQDLLDCGIVLLVITKWGKITIEREKRASLLERWNQHRIGFLVSANQQLWSSLPFFHVRVFEPPTAFSMHEREESKFWIVWDLERTTVLLAWKAKRTFVSFFPFSPFENKKWRIFEMQTARVL